MEFPDVLYPFTPYYYYYYTTTTTTTTTATTATSNLRFGHVKVNYHGVASALMCDAYL